MSLSATLTIEMSIIAISAAAITVIVIAAFEPWIGACMALLAFAISAGVDDDFRAHAGAQQLPAPVVDLYLDRPALGHLDEVAGRVLRRQEREPRAGAGRDAV